MQKLKIKVCGMTDPENMQAVCRHRPDYIGYIFFRKSVRYVGDDPDPLLFSDVPPGIQKTAVFVNENYERVIELTNRYDIPVVQMHGMESPETCRALRLRGRKVIKVFPGDQLTNRELLRDYEGLADYFLFDTPVISYGGSGRKFNWSGLKRLQSSMPFFLSGGIAADDVQLLKELEMPKLYAADINSRFETEPGIKDPELVGEFIKRMRNET